MADAGTPIVLAAPNSHEAATYRAIAARIWEKVEAPAATGPKITME